MIRLALAVVDFMQAPNKKAHVSALDIYQTSLAKLLYVASTIKQYVDNATSHSIIY